MSDAELNPCPAAGGKIGADLFNFQQPQGDLCPTFFRRTRDNFHEDTAEAGPSYHHIFGGSTTLKLDFVTTISCRDVFVLEHLASVKERGIEGCRCVANAFSRSVFTELLEHVGGTRLRRVD